MNKIQNWFGTSIYRSSIEGFNNINKSILPLITKNVKNHNSTTARSTDTQSEETKTIGDTLHTDKKFNKLFKQIEKEIKSFLNHTNLNNKIFDAYITKAWATCTFKDQYVSFHRHMASHFSFVYYVKAENQGNIVFIDDQTRLPGLQIERKEPNFTQWSNFNASRIEYPSQSGVLIIFPSSLYHETLQNKSNDLRVSISGDIILTMKKGVKSENNLPSPSTWKKV